MVVTDNGSGNLVVNFRVKIVHAAYTTLDSTTSGIIAADLVPAGTVAVTLDGSSPELARVRAVGV